jgi:hypothetical protein
MFSIAGGAITKLMIASISVCALENLQAISEFVNILLKQNRSAVRCLVTTMMFQGTPYKMQICLLLLIQHHLICFTQQ